MQDDTHLKKYNAETFGMDSNQITVFIDIEEHIYGDRSAIKMSVAHRILR